MQSTSLPAQDGLPYGHIDSFARLLEVEAWFHNTFPIVRPLCEDKAREWVFWADDSPAAQWRT